eukprot:snap_masked-scaffold_33-processed-gene-0.41-mRNA-1 protein AED:1.00 eAED:1.00 QI:0/-1/0/0/-1/1/1/0/274
MTSFVSKHGNYSVLNLGGEEFGSCGCTTPLTQVNIGDLPKADRISSTKDIFSNQVAKAEFKECLKKAFAEENFLFYEDVSNFEKLPEDQLEIEGMRILEEYILDNSPTWINLPSQVSSQLVSLETFSRNCFSAAKEEIYFLMHANFLDDFKLHLTSLHFLNCDLGKQKMVAAIKNHQKCFLRGWRRLKLFVANDWNQGNSMRSLSTAQDTPRSASPQEKSTFRIRITNKKNLGKKTCDSPGVSSGKNSSFKSLSNLFRPKRKHNPDSNLNDLDV